ALAALRAARIGFVLQTGGLLPYLSVRENILLPRRLLGLPADSARVGHAIDVLSLRGLLEKKPAQLSIGERQRVAVV
ncbi:ATP-binding cassette domain-containing protein, partial [Campylobacter lari]|nr:ABC transporter ATP-binding protein [Campylobacter lari]